VVRRDRSEGSYTVIDMEHAGRAGLVWTLDPLQHWDESTLDKVASQAQSSAGVQNDKAAR
jgi:cytochrome c2